MSLFSNYVPFKEKLNRYLTKCGKVFSEIGDRQSAANVNGFLKDLDRQRFCITIMGSLKRGKSTLLNALMERSDDDISPIASEVCTSAIVKYSDKSLADDNDKEHAIVYFHDDDKSPASIPLTRLRDYVTESSNRENRKGVRSVEVYGDFPAWSKAVTIVDSPGQNAVYDYHDTLLQDFLPYTDAIIFLIAADLPIDGGDFKLLHELSKDEQKKLFFVITKADAVENEDDLDAVKDRVADILTQVGLKFAKVYCTAAKPVFEKLCSGKCTADELENLKQEHGIRELEDDLEHFIIRESKDTEVFAKRVKTILEATAAACSQYVDVSKSMLARMTVDVASLQLNESKLTDENEKLGRQLKNSLKEFDRKWSREIDRVHRKFTAKADRVADKISEEIGENKGMVDAITKSFSLKKRIHKAFNAEVQDVVLDLESKLDAIVRNLDKEFSDDVDLYFRKPKGKDDVTGGVLGFASGAAVAGAAAWGVSAASGSVIAAQAAFSAWNGARGAAAAAATATTFRQAGLFKWLGHFFAGQPDTVVTTVKASTETAAAAISAGAIAICNIGVSIVATYLAKKILTMGLSKVNEMRVSGIVEDALSEMEKCLCEALEEYRKSISKEYSSRIENITQDNANRLTEIRKLIAKDDPEARTRLTNKCEKVQKLLTDCVHVQKELPLLKLGKQ